jgi:DNA-directed RNA polymerase subunit omega
MTDRLTSQAAVEAIGNRFDLVLVASQRARELKSGAYPKVEPRGSFISTALKEIEEGKYTLRDYLNKIPAKRKKSHKDEYFST